MSVFRFSKEDVLKIHEMSIKKFGGSPGIRDEKLLESAISSPYQTFDGKLLYPDLIDRISRLGFNIIKNHPFIDGNKRTGINLIITSLLLEGITINVTNRELIELGLKITELKDHQYIVDFLNSKIKIK
ncbi:MAG: type II toxin-antitoxin system death-on-curing family toxin [Clostridiaceae bacterium]|nr:type II toxin-antitoxin system death-on-curing family toxin [Clostridiaceae bacterium]